MYELLYVFIGGGAGSLCRYTLGQWLPRPSQEAFPWSTLVANLIGCLLIGLLWGYLERRQTGWMQLMLITGFCGGFTTFSTFSHETLTLLRQGQHSLAFLYLFVSLVAGIGCTACGYFLPRLIAHYNN